MIHVCFVRELRSVRQKLTAINWQTAHKRDIFCPRMLIWHKWLKIVIRGHSVRLQNCIWEEVDNAGEETSGIFYYRKKKTHGINAGIAGSYDGCLKVRHSEVGNEWGAS